MTHNLFVRTVAGIMFFGAALTTQLATAADQRTIVVNSTSTQASLEFQFKPVKPAFDFQEPLEFTLKANQDVFLYIYTVTPQGDYALILPNNMQTQNKYPANTAMQVPNSNVAFRADGSVAIEPVYAIASTRYIDLELAKQRKAGDFSVIGAQDMQDRFGSKGIVLRDLEDGESEVQVVTIAPDEDTQATSGDNNSSSTTNTNGSDRQVVVAEATLVRVDVPIENIPAQPATDDSEGVPDKPVITFVATDKSGYQRGDTVHIVFGASQPGKVALYLIDPDGSGEEEPITTRDVDGKGFISVSATNDGEIGKHVIKAVFQPPTGTTKGLILNEDDKAPESSHAVTIAVE